MRKTVRNNFDKSSTGVDIECICQYDSGRSRWEFEENIQIVQHDGYRTTSIGYYIDNGNVKGHVDIKFTVKGTRERKIEYLDEIFSVTKEDIQTWDDATLDSEIMSYVEVTLIDYVMDRMDSIDGLEFTPNKNLIVLTTRGYSQGDYAKVIYCPDDIEKAWGRYPKQEDIQKMVNHYFWDAPIFAVMTIDGKEYDYQEMPEYDDYEWKRDKFLEYVAKESGIEREKLEKFVPEYPEYN